MVAHVTFVEPTNFKWVSHSVTLTGRRSSHVKIAHHQSLYILAIDQVMHSFHMRGSSPHSIRKENSHFCLVVVGLPKHD